MKPQISIIIVNYNSGELLYNCLTSIKRELKQCKYEVIVVDNCSTDNSMSLCAGFEMPDTGVGAQMSGTGAWQGQQ